MRPGERVGDRFVLEREIGSGGMSTVYLGRDEVLDRKVAIKILRGSFDEVDVGPRFEREGRTAARLSHANVVQVYDAGRDDLGEREISYIVMEYVSGGDLKKLIDEEGRLPGKRLSSIGADIAAGLAHAHERGIVHRDIKPQNVLMDEYGNPKLTDFGIARALVEGTTSSGISLTETHAGYLGTALYSSPEQLNGKGVTFKSDIYSLGVTLYHAAVGEPPFSGSPIEVASQQMTKSPQSPRSRGARITPSMEHVILSCLSKDPKERPSADELQTSLLRSGVYAGTGASAAQLGAESQDSKPLRRISGRPDETVSLPTRTFQGSRGRGPLIVGAVAVVFLILVALGGIALLGGDGNDGTTAADQSGNSDSGNSGSGDSGGSGGNGDSGDGQATPPETTQAAEESTREEPEETTSGETTSQDSQESDSGPLPPTEQASDAVFDLNVANAQNQFDISWDLLSSRYQQEIGSVEEWTSQEEDLDYVQFNSGLPEATLDGREARVTFTAEETRSGTPQTVSGTWIAVNQDGEWKLDRLLEN